MIEVNCNLCANCDGQSCAVYGADAEKAANRCASERFRHYQPVTVKIGQALPKESWIAARDDLARALPLMAEVLRNINFNGMGDQDAEEFLAESQLAIEAMTYVAEFAADKCRIIVKPGN